MKAAIFDVDGTLVDSVFLVAAVRKRSARGGLEVIYRNATRLLSEYGSPVFHLSARTTSKGAGVLHDSVRAAFFIDFLIKL